MTQDERKLCSGSEYGQVGERRFTLFENDITTMAVELDLLYDERRFFILDEIKPFGGNARYFGQVSGRFDRFPDPVSAEHYEDPRTTIPGKDHGWLRLKERARGRKW